MSLAGRRFVLFAAGSFLLACANASGASLQPEEGPRVVESTEPETIDYAAALAASEDETARRQVALSYLRSLEAGGVLALPEAWLVNQPASALRLLGESAEDPSQLEALVDAIARALRPEQEGQASRIAPERFSPDARLAAASILARSQRPISAALLIDWLEAAPRRERLPIVQALVTMTGRDDLGASVEDWRQWLARNRHLPPLAWKSMLIEGTRERATRLERRQRELVARLTENSRRIYGVLPEDQRAPYLVTLLSDAEPSIRAIGTELVLRELERGVLPGPEVGAAIVGLLDDPTPSLRQAAAVLVDRIVPQGSAARLTVALRKEAEPEVAAVMLRAFRRSPDSAAIDAILRWREAGPPTAEDALRALVALLNAGFTPTDAQRERILATIDAARPAELTLAAVAVLDRIGGQAGKDAIVGLLASPRAELRRAAAETLAAYDWALNPLLDAAAADPDLLTFAADAVARHAPHASYLSRVAKLELRAPVGERPATDDDSAMPVTSTLARFMNWGERLASAHELASRPIAVRAILGEPTRSDFREGAAGDAAFAQARSLLALPGLGEGERLRVADADENEDGAETPPGKDSGSSPASEPRREPSPEPGQEPSKPRPVEPGDVPEPEPKSEPGG